MSSHTSVRYALTETCQVNLRIRDLNRRLVVERKETGMPPGKHSFTFSGKGLPDGPYLCEVTAGSKRSVITLLKISP